MTDTTKRNADFQSQYNRSKNFSSNAKDENLEPIGKGKLKLNSEENISEKDKKKIADAMDDMHERMEITPGGEQTDTREEE